MLIVQGSECRSVPRENAPLDISRDKYVRYEAPV